MEFKYFRGLYSICFVLCFLPFLAAQTVGTASDNGSQPPVNSVIRVNSNLVSVPISVTDVSGRGITDLLIDDFRITEDGKPAEISRLASSGQSNLNT